MITGKQLVEQAKKHLGEPYVYGCKHEKLTLERYKYLQKTYGKNCVLDSDKNKVGKICCDCSGLIGVSLQELGVKGYIIGSSQFKDKSTTVKPISDIKNAPVGALLWLKGHIGIYIGDNKYIAEDGSAYGCRIAKLNQNKWTHYLLLENIIKYDNEDELSGAVSCLNKKGIKIDKMIWGNYNNIEKNLKNVPYLIEKLGGLSKLSSKGVISDKKLWENKKYTASHVRSLLIKASKLL